MQYYIVITDPIKGRILYHPDTENVALPFHAFVFHSLEAVESKIEELRAVYPGAIIQRKNWRAD